MESTPRRKSTPVRLGRYELLRRIGAGGMGEVWLARVPEADGVRACVVKRMLAHLAGDRNFVERFLDEAKVVVHLAHPNIARVFEMGEVEGEYFMAMEYVAGKTLGRIAARLRERGERFPPEVALHLGVRLCDALAYAHRAADPAGRPLHVVHRDISPANVLVSYDGEVKVIDFGAAQSSIKEAHTAPRVVIGNLAYMSPEQARKRPVDGRADVYSACVVLWELLSGQQVSSGGDHLERWRRAAHPTFTSPSRFVPGLPAEVDSTVMRGLAADPRDRFQSADALRDELQKALTRIAPATGKSAVAELMARLFASDEAADRAVVADSLASSGPREAAPTPSEVPPEPATDPSASIPEHAAEEEPPTLTGTDPGPSPGTGPTLIAPPPGGETGERHGPDDLSGRTTSPYRTPWLRNYLAQALVFAVAFAIGVALAGALFFRPGGSPATAPPEQGEPDR